MNEILDNAAVMRRMAEQGDDLSSPRNIEFSVIFPDESSAKSFVAAISQHFNSVKYAEMETSVSLKWDVTATRFMIPSHQGITQTEQFLENTAAAFEGENDGWGRFNVTK